MQRMSAGALQALFSIAVLLVNHTANRIHALLLPPGISNSLGSAWRITRHALRRSEPGDSRAQGCAGARVLQFRKPARGCTGQARASGRRVTPMLSHSPFAV